MNSHHRSPIEGKNLSSKNGPFFRPPHELDKSAGIFSGKVSQGGVLVVDDEADIRKVVRLMLEKRGYHVIEAEDGGKAMEAVKSGENPMVLDVIITDLRMPKINGVEAITYFQKEYPSVPLIVLTGFPDIAMATLLLKQGIVDYLVKPVEGEKLYTSVANAMEKRHFSWL